MKSKRCSKCGEVKNISEFYKSAYGHRSMCKSCNNQTSKDNEYKYKETRKKYKNDNKTLINKKAKEYYNQNKTSISLKHKEYRISQKGKYSKYKKNAINRNKDWNLSNDEFQSFWQQDCFYCGESIDTIGLDRVDNGSGYSMDNCIPCCSKCNKMKNTLSIKDFINKIKRIYNSIVNGL